MPRNHSKKSLWQQGKENEYTGNDAMPNKEMPPFPNREMPMTNARPQYNQNNPYMDNGYMQQPPRPQYMDVPPHYNQYPMNGHMNRPQPMQQPYPMQRPPMPPQGQPMMGYRPRINVVTQMVDNYDPRNVEYARTIVQPIALVPYNSEEDTMQYYGGNYENGYDYDSESDYEEENTRKRFNALKLFTFIFGLLTIAVLVLGKFLNMDAIKPYLEIMNGKSGLDAIMEITTVLSSSAEIMDKLPTILLTAGTALLVILVIISLFSMKRGTGGFSKFIAVLMVLCMIGFAILALVNKTISTGGYIVGGLSLLTGIMTFVGKKYI